MTAPRLSVCIAARLTLATHLVSWTGSTPLGSSLGDDAVLGEGGASS